MIIKKLMKILSTTNEIKLKYIKLIKVLKGIYYVILNLL